MTAPLVDVVHAIRRQLPGLPNDNVGKLLYWCQGHSLALAARPMFDARIIACVDGPTVEGGIPDGSTAGRLERLYTNTILHVTGRYGGLTIHDMALLSRAETPWQDTPVGQEISHNALRVWFHGPGSVRTWVDLERQVAHR